MRSISKSFLLGAAGLILAALLFAATLNPSLGSFSGDEARFVLLSRALAQGLGYIELQTPGHPPATEYLPGLPILLLPVTFWQDDNFLAMKVIILASAVLAMALIYFLFKTESRRLAWAIAVLVATMPLFLSRSSMILADVPYLAASLAALLWMAYAWEREDFRPRTWLIAGLLSALAFFFRPLGLALAAGAVAALIAGKPGQSRKTRGKALGIFITIFGLLVGGWFFRNYLSTGHLDLEHLSKLFVAKQSDPFAGKLEAGGILARVERQLLFYARAGTGELIPLGPERLRPWLILPALGLLGLGWGEAIFRRRGVLPWYLLFFMAMLAIWRFHNPRFLVPALPFFYFFGFQGLRLVGSGLGKRWPKSIRVYQVVAASLFALILFPHALESARLIRFWHTPRIAPDPASVPAATADALALELIRPLPCQDYVEMIDWVRQYPGPAQEKCRHYFRFMAAAEWIRRNLPADAITVSRKPTLLAVFSRGLCVQFPPEQDPEAMIQALARVRADYVLADEASPLIRSFFSIMADSFPEHFRVALAVEKTRLYRFIP